MAELEFFSGGPKLNRRRALQLAGASALASVAPFSVARAAPRPIKIGYVTPATGPLAPMGEADDYILKGVREALKKGVVNPAWSLSDRDPGQGQPVEPEPGGRGRRRTHPAGRNRPHGRRRDARELQSRLRPVRAQRRAVHLDHDAVAALVLRARGRSGQGLPVDLPLLLGHRGHPRGLHQHLEAGRHQQEGRVVPGQRRRRQRLGRSEAWLAAAC